MKKIKKRKTKENTKGKVIGEIIVRKGNLIIGGVIGVLLVVVCAAVYFNFSSANGVKEKAAANDAKAKTQQSTNNSAQAAKEKVVTNTAKTETKQPINNAVKTEPKVVESTTKNNNNSGNIPASELDKEKKVYVNINTSQGVIAMVLYPELMPTTINNFLGLMQKKFYDGLTFHRVEEWVIQGGDPLGNGSGGSDKTIPLETNPKLKNIRGAVAMARANDPNSASSQFYILKKDAPFLDGQYAVFGQVVSGMEVVDAIQIGDKMTEIKAAE